MEEKEGEFLPLKLGYAFGILTKSVFWSVFLKPTLENG